MAQSRRKEVLKHMIAMELMLMLQETADDTFQNTAYVTGTPAADRRTKNTAKAQLQDRGLRLRDLMADVDMRVYNAFQTALTAGFDVGDPPTAHITPGDIENALRTIASLYAFVSRQSDATLWCVPPVHPSSFVTREVVSALLEDRSIDFS